MMPVMPAVRPHSANASTRIRLVLMPGPPGRLGVAADRVDVTAEPGPAEQDRLDRPGCASTTSTTQGSPRTARTAAAVGVARPARPRGPATAITAIFSRVMRHRRGDQPVGAAAVVPQEHDRAGQRPRCTIITIQLAAGLSSPPSMSLMTLLFRLITPPSPMLPVALIR